MNKFQDDQDAEKRTLHSNESDIEAQTRALLTCNLACGHKVDTKKTRKRFRIKFRNGECGYGYYISVKLFCIDGHYTDWIEVGKIMPGSYDTLNHKREISLE